MEYTCTLSDYDLQVAKEELHENPEERLECIDILRKWVMKQQHIRCPADGKSVCLSVFLSVSLSSCLSVCLPVCLAQSFSLSLYLSLSLPNHSSAQRSQTFTKARSFPLYRVFVTCKCHICLINFYICQAPWTLIVDLINCSNHCWASWNFHLNPIITFWVMLLTPKQTDKLTPAKT